MLRRYRPQRPKQPPPRFKINHFITAPEVRVIGDDGKNFGIMSRSDALRAAMENNLDLIEVNPLANPPVCKMMDFGKFKYEQEKQARRQRANAKKTNIKGIRLSLRIRGQDLEMRKNQALKFLNGGDKVKVELMLKGRERAHANMAQQLIQDFIKSLEDVRIEQPLTKMGGNLTVMIAKK